MKILLNGVYFGGNCPPFYRILKDLGHDVKVYDALFEDSYSELSDIIDKEDLIIPKYSLFKFVKIKFYKKIFVSKWRRELSLNMSKIVSRFKPDVILNHQLSIRANIALDTKFSPQLNFVYGSEIKNDLKNIEQIKDAIDKAKFTFVPSLEAQRILVEKIGVKAEKIHLATTNFINPNKMMLQFSNQDTLKYRGNYNFSSQDFIIYDNRSLRDIELSNILVQSFKKLVVNYENCKLILVKGFSGNDKVIYEIRKKLEEYNLTSNVLVVDRIVSENEHYRFLSMSDVYCSILKDDEFGSGIAQAMYFRKKLLLSNLDIYKDYIKNNAAYIQSFTEQELTRMIISLIEGRQKIDLECNFNLANTKFNAITNTNNVLGKL